MFKKLFSSSHVEEPKPVTTTQLLKRPENRDKSETELVEEIHREFNTASDKALASAKEILASIDKEAISKSNRLSRLGFGKSKDVVETKQQLEAEKIASAKAKIITQYHTAFPLYKFISEEDVMAICRKYNLVCGPVSNFIGDVPEKNIKEIEAFMSSTVQASDYISYEIRVGDIDFYSSSSTLERDAMLAAARKMPAKYVHYNVARSYSRYTMESDFIKYCREVANLGYARVSNVDVKTRKCTDLLICAPKKDFDLNDLDQSGSYLVSPNDVSFTVNPDPVVLQRVVDGFLIVTAWGAEAQDPLVFNQINN